ncbi:hypothetical protein EDD85DRAFT_860858 [Armillaria nabsnona]|nr:hypothetical protein EDD85DRAFT_860858 [Armillaria nabsnona]
MLPMTTTLKNGIPSDSSLSIPQELLDYILDFLHDDSPTLRVCSLVSHAFLPCSHYHIYSSVFIVHVSELDLFREKYGGQLYQSKNLAALLEHSPHLAPLVTRFGIHGKSDWMTNVLMDTSLFSIIQSLRNLSHIEFISSTCDGYWIQFPLATHRLFLAALRSAPLKTLIFEGIRFPTDAQFEDIFTTAAANPALKHLLLRCWHNAGIPEPHPSICPPPNGLPALASLCITGSATYRSIDRLFFTRSLYSISSIRRLSLQLFPGTPSTGIQVQSLLNEMRETLECFTVDICPQIGGTVGFDLSQHRSLSSFHAIVTDPPGPDSIPGMRLCPTLRTLTVEHVSRAWQRDLQPFVHPWAEVDRLPLPALEHVYIKLHDSVHGNCYFHAQCNTCELRVQQKTDPGDLDNWKRQVEERMPLLKGRGILEVKVVKQRYCISTASD